MKTETVSKKKHHIVRTVIVGFGFLVVIVVLMAWLMGGLHRKVGAAAENAPAERPVGNMQLVGAHLIRVPATETAVGTVRAVHETSVASKILAKILSVKVKAGQTVKKGDVLVQLDDADLIARRQQAVAGVDAARAVRDQAKVEFDRVTRLFKDSSAAQIELDRATTALKSAEADLQRAEQGLKETQTILEYATIRSPIDGLVVDKKVDAGDTATPGQVLVTLYDPTHMQLVASVRESLTHRLKVGQMIPVGVDALGLMCEGQVSEIVPEAETSSRSFQVKVTGPCPSGIYAGMFGRLIIPLGDEELLVIPQAAVSRVGQLDVVDVAEGGFLHRRVVQLGRTVEDDVQVLSGLVAGERVAVAQPASREGA
jgi:membrane fusion protein, multidrug efflux system